MFRVGRVRNKKVQVLSLVLTFSSTGNGEPLNGERGTLNGEPFK